MQTNYPTDQDNHQTEIDKTVLDDADPGIPAALNYICQQETSGQYGDQNPRLPKVIESKHQSIDQTGRFAKSQLLSWEDVTAKP